MGFWLAYILCGMSFVLLAFGQLSAIGSISDLVSFVDPSFNELRNSFGDGLTNFVLTAVAVVLIIAGWPVIAMVLRR